MKKLEVTICILLLLLSEPFPFPRIIENIISLTSYVFLLFVIIGRSKKYFFVAVIDKTLLLILGFALLSVFWSANPSSTIYQFRLVIRSTLFGVYLAMQFTPREQIRLLSWVMSIAMILSLIMSLFFPSQGIQDINGTLAWTGIYTHKQLLGRQMGLAASLFLIQNFAPRNNRWISIIGLCLSFAILLLSQSKTGLLIFAFSTLLIPLYQLIIKQKKNRLIIFLLFFLAYSILSIIVTLNFEYIVIDVFGKNLEFNGRIPLWSLALEKGLEQPWLGYGYRGFWSSEVSNYVLYNSWGGMVDGFKDRGTEFHSHNGLIDLFLELGLIGFLIFLLNFSLLIKRVFTLLIYTRYIEFFWMLELASIFWIANITESHLILSSTNTLWILYVSLLLSSAIEDRRIKKNLRLNLSTKTLKIAI